MRKLLVLTACVGFVGAAAVHAIAADTKAPPAYVSAALNDPGRPKADTDNDALRKPAEMLAFAGIKPGSLVAELVPGGGYFTRIFAKAVAPGGHVYALSGPGRAGQVAAAATIAADPRYGGVVTYAESPLEAVTTPRPVDVVWTSRNYHDWTPAQRAGVNKAAFAMLKPGGIYIVLDHSAVVGTGNFAMEQPGGPANALHRIDENQVKLDVLKAGFKLVGENNTLRNPKDTRTNRVFDNTIRGDTDQFILKFQKPKA